MPVRNLRQLLLADKLDDAVVASLLQPYGFTEYRRADANLQALADEPVARRHFAELIEPLIESLAESPDPEQALDYLERFAKAYSNKVSLFTHLRASPASLHLLAIVFGSSPFLSQILIRNPEYLHWVIRPDVLERPRNRRELMHELQRSIRSFQSKEHCLDALRRFKRREMLAIGVRDLLGRTSVREATEALTSLAEVIIQEAYAICRKALAAQYRISRKRFAVMAMGKLGGGELNFSSDVDLVYVSGSDAGMDPGYAKQLAQDLTRALSAVTNEGYLFRVDLRLRPEGKSGNIVGSLSQARRYYRGERGEAWERLAQIKAWPIAGDKTLGRDFLKMVQPFVYQSWQSSSPTVLLDAVKRVKTLIDEKMVRRGESQRNVKLGIGGIREIELIVQSLQALFGRKVPTIRERNTTRALSKLLRARLVSKDEHDVLLDAYWFLRNVEHKLQMVEAQQTHTLSTDPLEVRRCALRLGYRDGEQGKASEQLLRDYARYSERAHQIFQKVTSGDRLNKEQ